MIRLARAPVPPGLRHVLTVFAGLVFSRKFWMLALLAPAITGIGQCAVRSDHRFQHADAWEYAAVRAWRNYVYIANNVIGDGIRWAFGGLHERRNRLDTGELRILVCEPTGVDGRLQVQPDQRIAAWHGFAWTQVHAELRRLTKRDTRRDDWPAALIIQILDVAPEFDPGRHGAFQMNPIKMLPARQDSLICPRDRSYNAYAVGLDTLPR